MAHNSIGDETQGLHDAHGRLAVLRAETLVAARDRQAVGDTDQIAVGGRPGHRRFP